MPATTQNWRHLFFLKKFIVSKHHILNQNPKTDSNKLQVTTK